MVANSACSKKPRGKPGRVPPQNNCTKPSSVYILLLGGGGTAFGNIREVDQPGRPTAQATGDSPSFAKALAGGPEFIGGPRPTITVNLSGYSGGPSMHLLRSLQYNQLQIRFDQGQPDEPFLAMLKRARWTDRTESEGVWTKQIDPNARWQSVDQMEKEFKTIANAIREERGLEPVLDRLALA
jgi:hypothetical protein